MNQFPEILSLKQQDELSRAILRKRLDTILPMAMREAGIDMWLIISQEDDYDPVFRTMMPLRTWAPILQILMFTDKGPEQGIERINLSMTDLGDLFEKPWKGRTYTEQWPLLAQLVGERDPQRIGINTGSVQWAAGGLTYNLYQQLCAALPASYAARLVSAEAACTRWLETLVDDELQYYPHLVRITHAIIRECYSPRTITPGVTTTDDLQWAFWQHSQSLGLDQSFIPFFNLVRSSASQRVYPVEDKVIRPGDIIHCDVGNRYLKLCSDLQEWAYIRCDGETDAPAGLKNLFTQVNHLQQVFLSEFKAGLSGDELLAHILQRAHAAGIPNPKIYSHSLGYYLHEPGPLIGLPWEQVNNPGRGEVRLVSNSTFTMELSISANVPEWQDQPVSFSCEQDVRFSADGCKAMDGVQTAFYLV
jgi:Xaa-Pro aminopeptidase